MKIRNKERFILLTIFVVTGIVVNAAVHASDLNEDYILEARLSENGDLLNRDTGARGTLQFSLSDDGNKLQYKLSAAEIKGVTAAQIFMASDGRRGRVVVTLFNLKEVPKKGSFDGTYSQGVIQEKDLVGPLVGNQLSALLKEMEEGHTYVVIRTEEYPEGHIRGKIVDPSSLK